MSYSVWNDHLDGRWAINSSEQLDLLIVKSGWIAEFKTLQHHFELPGRFSSAMWTMWKIVLSRQVRGKWSFDGADDNSYVAFYFENDNDLIFCRLLAGNDDLPNDGWVPIHLCKRYLDQS